MKKSNTEAFIEKSNLKHKNRFNYSKSNYVNSQTKVIVICENNHEFLVRPDMHLSRGHGCRICYNESMYKDNDAFKKQIEEIFPEKYTYELVDYKGVYDKVKIICKEHGAFTKSPNTLIKGRGCNKCYKNGKLDIELFIEKANIIHKNRYLYDKSVYVNSRTKIDIVCKKHGVFSQLSNNHLRGHGCNKCNRSFGEIEIENFLEENNIEYKTEYTFDDLRYRYPLRFDFVVTEYNNIKYLIEFNGKQHYNYYPNFHNSENDFIESKERDQLKIDYCLDNNIKLYIIRYDENLNEHLQKIIKENEDIKNRV